MHLIFLYFSVAGIYRYPPNTYVHVHKPMHIFDTDRSDFMYMSMSMIKGQFEKDFSHQVSHFSLDEVQHIIDEVGFSCKCTAKHK